MHSKVPMREVSSSWTRKTSSYEDFSDTEKKRYDADVVTPILCFKGLPKRYLQVINHNIEEKQFGTTMFKVDRIRIRGILLGEMVQQEMRENRAGNANAGQGTPVKCYNCNGVGHIARNYTQPRVHRIMIFKDKMLLMQAQENGAVLDEEELLFLAGEQGNTFDADVDNQPVQDLALNEDNIVQADDVDAFRFRCDDENRLHVYFHGRFVPQGGVFFFRGFQQNPQAGPSNASILSEVHILENVIDHSVSNQDEHEIHNVIPYEQYLSVNDISVVLNCAQNPFYLRQAKKAQPAYYDGEELLKTHHVPVNVPSSEEELELAEATRNKLHVKMNDSACVEKRVNITPPNYSKENFMATFTPQTQLTPEQVFWSIDLEKRKAEELKANAPPLPVLPPATVYPPNTPVHLVPRTLPTTSQVNIGLYVITQLFWDFEKTCKKRITPTGITEGERGFEQTKRCYLTEVIPFFNLLKEHFEGIQKSLVTEVRAMKVVFENLEAEVDQNEIDLKSGEIERKNLLITNENLIAECLSKDVFYTATDSVLNVSRFSDMHDAFTIAQKRIADLESENFNLRNKIQNDDHDSMIKHFSKLEVEHFNLQLKYQNLKERFGNKKPVTSSDAPSFDSLFVIGKLNEQIQNPTFDLKALVSQNKDFTAKLNALHDLNECFRAENTKVKQHYKELYDSIKITRSKTTDQNNSLLSEIENLKAQLNDNSKCVTIPDSKPKVLAPGRYPIDVEPIPLRLKKNREVLLHYIKHLKETVETLREIVEDAKVERPLDTSLASACRYTKHSQELSKGASATSRSKPRSNTKKDKTLPAKSALKQVEAHSRMNKSNEKQKNRVDSRDQWPLTRNTPPKVLPTKQWKPNGRLLPLRRQCPLVRSTAFKSDCMPADPQETIAPVVQIVLWVYYVEGLGHNLFSVGQFCDSDLEVAFRKYTCFVRDLDGVDLINGNRSTNLYTISVEDMMRSSPICLPSKASKNKSWLRHRRLNHLNFGTLNDLAHKDLVRGLPRLKFDKDHLCSAYQLGKSRKSTHKPKTINTIMEVLHTLHMDLCGSHG
ncbi:integrase, catalytic region, zinc finger, CCHC-type containing protein [Tanacetum coccineum]